MTQPPDKAQQRSERPPSGDVRTRLTEEEIKKYRRRLLAGECLYVCEADNLMGALTAAYAELDEKEREIARMREEIRWRTAANELMQKAESITLKQKDAEIERQRKDKEFAETNWSRVVVEKINLESQLAAQASLLSQAVEMAKTYAQENCSIFSGYPGPASSFLSSYQKFKKEGKK